MVTRRDFIGLALSGIIAAYAPSIAYASTPCHAKKAPIKVFKRDLSEDERKTLTQLLAGEGSTDIAGSAVQFKNTLRAGDRKSEGNGVYLGNGLILTAGHLVGVFATQSSGDGILLPNVEKPVEYRIVVKSNREDLALIRVKNKHRHYIEQDSEPRIQMYNGTISKGDALVHISTNPGNHEGDVRTGIRSSYDRCGPTIRFNLPNGSKLTRINQHLTSAPQEERITQGDSGSGVYCVQSNGQPALCGITTGVSEERSTFVDHTSIRKMLESYLAR